MYTAIKNTERCKRVRSKCTAERGEYTENTRINCRRQTGRTGAFRSIRIGQTDFGVQQHIKWIWRGGTTWQIAPGQQLSQQEPPPGDAPDDPQLKDCIYDTTKGGVDETKAWSKVESPVHTKESKQGRKQPGSKSNRSKGTHNYKKEEFIGDGGNPTHVHKYNSTSGHVKVNNKEYKYGTGNAKTDEQSMHDALNALNAYNGDVHKKEQILEFIVALINQYK